MVHVVEVLAVEVHGATIDIRATVVVRATVDVRAVDVLGRRGTRL